MSFQALDVLTSLPNAEIICGPEHPRKPRKELANVLSDIISRNPFLGNDRYYIQFLKVVGGLCIDTNRSIEDPEYYFAILYELDGVFCDESTAEITEDGFFVIGEFCFNKPSNSGSIQEMTNVYAFDATGNRKSGIYRSTYIDGEMLSGFGYQYESFEAFISNLISSQGILKSS